MKPLTLSSSIILFNWSQKQPQILMIHRAKGISFSNMYAFPGGVCDLQDKKYSNQFTQYSKITAIRQLLEEVGLLLIPPNFNKQELLILNQDIINQKIGHIWKNDLNLIHPLIRFLTIQIPKVKRFDCIFFTPNPTVKILNYRLYKQDKNQLYELKSLKLNVQESIHYVWESPKKLLEKHALQQIILAPPQIIILSCLKRLKYSQQLNIFSKDCCNQPILMNLYQSYFLMPWDKDYIVEKVLQNQPKSQSKQYLRKYFQKSKNKNNNSQCIRRFSQIDTALFKSNYKETSILKLIMQNPSL